MQRAVATARQAACHGLADQASGAREVETQPDPVLAAQHMLYVVLTWPMPHSMQTPFWNQSSMPFLDPLSVRLPTSPSTLSCVRRQVLADDKAIADDAATAPCIESFILRPL